MLFILDQDVDAHVATVLRALGQQAHTAFEIGHSRSDDGELAVAVDERRGILVSHDVKFSKERRRRVWGRHVWLRCIDIEASDVVQAKMPEILPILEHNPDLFVAMSKTTINLSW